MEPTKLNSFRLFIVDAFAKRAFKGNGAAVCLLPFEQDVDDATKQKVASEMNLSETAFIKLINKEDTFETANSFLLQWFTPICQVPLCGHATLASAAVLFKDCSNQNDILNFHTQSGILKAQKRLEDRIQIDLPAYKTHTVDGKFDNLVKKVIGQLPVNQVVLSESKKLLILLSDQVTRAELEAIPTNDTDLMAENVKIAGVIVTLSGMAQGCVDEDGNKYDFVSRYFAPWMGISEDPVTGSAHSVLAPFWANILNKNSLYAHQCSSRGGDLHIELVHERALISGNVVIVVKGNISF